MNLTGNATTLLSVAGPLVAHLEPPRVSIDHRSAQTGSAQNLPVLKRLWYKGLEFKIKFASVPVCEIPPGLFVLH